MNNLNKGQVEPNKITGLNKSSFSRIGGALLAILVGMGFAIWSGINFTSSSPNAQNSISSYYTKPPNTLQVLDWEWKNVAGDRAIVGRVKNNSNKQYSYVQVEFNLYDRDKNHLGTAIANTNNLEANSTWKFTAMPLIVATGQIDSAKLKDISGF